MNYLDVILAALFIAALIRDVMKTGEWGELLALFFPSIGD